MNPADNDGNNHDGGRKLQNLTRTAFLRFALVGTIGFALDSALLYLLKFSLGLYLGRLISFLSSVTLTWFLNRSFTFAGREMSAASSGYARYLVSMLGGGLVNYATYAVLVALSPEIARLPILGVAAGSIAGLVVNFTLASKFVFPAGKPKNSA